jgi:hypothetical protein
LSNFEFAIAQKAYHGWVAERCSILDTRYPNLGRAVFGGKMDMLMRMLSAYKIAQTRKREKLIRMRRVERAA